MSDLALNKFHCIHCGLDLTHSRIDQTQESICPDCGKTTDPYNPLASKVKKLNPISVFAKVCTAALLPGIGFGIVMVASPFLFVLLWPTLIAPSLLSDRILKKMITSQRRIIIATLWVAWITGFLAGVVGLLSIL